ncbi:kinesin-like protein KIN-14O isoform X4 [Lycium barbarum]|uniref:kinesin-like protein KIN-14O isoform X4 n=1 Tax=Lycium barbarum TaxID=112863 RepID=UPI00293F36ED|nr:kinesin-like protein KIN-14O isoform X4 [Lycium barbarum]
MEEEKKKRKNKKKKNKQTKGIENNAVGAEESASSNQNHAAEIRGSESHTDGTSGIDEDFNRHDTDGAKVATFEEKIKQLQQDKVVHMQKEAIFEEKLKQLAQEKDASLLKEASFEEKIMQSQKEISSLRRQEANQVEKIRELHMEKDVYLQKEAEFEMKNSQLQSEKDSWLQKEAGLEKRNNELVDEVEKLNSKRVGLEERISLMVGEVENLNSVRVSLEEKVKEMEKERDNWIQKEKSFREIISSLSGDNALLEAQVKEFEELRTNIVQENQLLKENVQVLQTQVSNLEKSAALPYSPTGSKMNTPENGDPNSEGVATQALVDKLVDKNAELVEKVNKLYVELERRGPPMEVSSFLGSDIITRSSEAARVANESALGSHKMPGAVQEHEVDYATEPKSKPSKAVLQSGETLQSPKDAIDKAASDHEHVTKIDSRIDVNSSEIESDEIVQIPLDENEVQSADLEAANVDHGEEEVPLSNAPLIGAPFRLISFFARYVSGADLVNKNTTSN